MNIDSPIHEHEIRRTILSKPSLKRLYDEFYSRYRRVIERCPPGGALVELGSGAGFAKDYIPELITTDVLAYQGVDQVVDATDMPFPDHSVRFMGMINVLHHIPNAERFFREADRVLTDGGRVLIIDQHKGWISTPILRHLHHEAFHPEAQTWSFPSSGPLSGANGALAWIIFCRDRARFTTMFPGLRLVCYQTHTPLRYWLCGGLKKWNLLPAWAYNPICRLETLLLAISQHFGSFCYVEIVKE